MFAKTSLLSQGLAAEDELFGAALRVPALRTHQLPRGAHFPPQVPLDESSYWPATAAATGRRACHGGWAPRASLPGALSARTGSPAAAAEGRAMLLSMIDRRTDILAGDRCCRGMARLQEGLGVQDKLAGRALRDDQLRACWAPTRALFQSRAAVSRCRGRECAFEQRAPPPAVFMSGRRPSPLMFGSRAGGQRRRCSRVSARCGSVGLTCTPENATPPNAAPGAAPLGLAPRPLRRCALWLCTEELIMCATVREKSPPKQRA